MSAATIFGCYILFNQTRYLEQFKTVLNKALSQRPMPKCGFITKMFKKLPDLLINTMIGFNYMLNFSIIFRL